MESAQEHSWCMIDHVRSKGASRPPDPPPDGGPYGAPGATSMMSPEPHGPHPAFPEHLLSLSEAVLSKQHQNGSPHDFFEFTPDCPATEATPKRIPARVVCSWGPLALLPKQRQISPGFGEPETPIGNTAMLL